MRPRGRDLNQQRLARPQPACSRPSATIAKAIERGILTAQPYTHLLVFEQL